MLKIKSVEPSSIGAELGLEEGDIILALNQSPARDILDYFVQIAGEEVCVRVKTKSGQLVDYEIEKEYEEDLGLEFELRARQCRNKCVFCFIDQQPPNLRKTLYIKDDDYRLSFLHGNYISLTNLGQPDIRRIIAERISPLYVSVHATDPGVRARLLGGSSGPDVMPLLQKLADSGLAIHAQIVLCPGYNDGEVLQKTLEDLASLKESLLSLAVVPVGLTKYRENLTPLKPVDKEVALEVIKLIAAFQLKFLKSLKRRVVFAADEFFVRADLPVPGEEYYEDFAQLENGIGLIRKALLQIEELKKMKTVRSSPYRVLLVTGTAALSTLTTIAEAVMKVLPDISIKVQAVENRFLGRQVTVAGLLAGADIQDFAAHTDFPWDILLVPEVSVRAGCFIDDYTLDDLACTLDKPVFAAGDVLEVINIFRKEVL